MDRKPNFKTNTGNDGQKLIEFKFVRFKNKIKPCTSVIAHMYRVFCI